MQRLSSSRGVLRGCAARTSLSEFASSVSCHVVSASALMRSNHGSGLPLQWAAAHHQDCHPRGAFAARRRLVELHDCMPYLASEI